MKKIAAEFLYPINSKPLRKGFVTLNDQGVICEIGEVNDNDIEIHNGIIIPGFVNAHCHLELSHLKGLFERGTGMTGFIRQIREAHNSVDQVQITNAIQREMVNLYSEGVSAIADISNNTSSFETKSTSPVYSRTFIEVYGTELSDKDQILSKAIDYHNKATLKKLDASITPHSCYSMSNLLFKEATLKGVESGFVSLHNQESLEEDQFIKRGKGALADNYRATGLSIPQSNENGTIDYLIQTLNIPFGEKISGNLLLVHNTFTDKYSIKRIYESFINPFWAISPRSNLFINRILPPIKLLIKEGATITVGTDSLASNSSLSMIEELKTIHNYFSNIPLTMSLKWATLNGALFLNKERRLGSLEVGKQPGIVLIENADIDNFMLTPNSKSKRLA